MRTRFNALSAGILAFATLAAPAFSETSFKQTASFDIPEANQAVAVDKDFFYAIDNRTIAKYTKGGKLVTKWQGASDGPIIHLDSGVVLDGKLYAAHSNYRRFPLTSSIEVWDTRSMKHIGSHSIGIALGSLTWLDKHDGSWYGAFANYDKTGQTYGGVSTTLPYATVPDIGKASSTIVRFNADWQVAEGWVFPAKLLDSFGDMSNSGGSWGPDGRLYITGHDNTEVYKIKFPEAGSVLEVEETIPATVRGQGIARDPSHPGIFWGVIRATDAETAQGITNKVVVFDTNVPTRDPKDWLKDLYKFRP